MGKKDQKSIPWRDAFPDISEDSLAADILIAARHKTGISQKKLSAMSGISLLQIREMERGNITIDEGSARRLARSLNSDYRVFLKK
jgi:ribosome-binding protein aMBF1 (putative translation factor)